MRSHRPSSPPQPFWPRPTLLRRKVPAGWVLAALFWVLPAAAEQSECRRLLFADMAGVTGLEFLHDRGVSAARHMPETFGSGLAWLDYDEDGWWDLYVVQSGALPPDGSSRGDDQLFRNRGDGTFENVSQRANIAAPPAHRGYGLGATAADVDGDGHMDLFLTNYGPDRLLLNKGDGTYRDATADFGLELDGWSSAAAFADGDGDGDLDLYVGRCSDYQLDHELFCGDLDQGRRDYCHPIMFTGLPDRYFVNLGGGGFQEASLSAGLTGFQERALGVVFTDLDGDSRPDIYVSNDLGFNLLFRNRGDGTFEDLSLLSGAAVNMEGDVEAGMGLAAGDVDGDGDQDLMVTHFDVETNTFYLNQGGLQFKDASVTSGFGMPSFNRLGFGICLADFDLDGDLDVYVANGHILEQPTRDGVSYAQPDQILAGDGRGGFVECPPPAVAVHVGRGAAVADYDNDRDPDVAIQNSGGPLQLLRNEVEEMAWLGVDLRGKSPNTAAVGARVTLRLRAGDGVGQLPGKAAGDAAESEAAGRRAGAHERTEGGLSQSRWVMAGVGYESSSDDRLLFGVPAGQVAVELEIAWPSGRLQRIEAPATAKYVTVTEP